MRRAHAIVVVLFSMVAGVSEGALDPVDVVQIDTGNEQDFSGILQMRSTCSSCWDSHGTLMAGALSDELSKRASKPVRAESLVWRNQADIVRQVYAAMKRSPRVIAMSLAGDGHFSAEYEALRAATDRGILVLAAAGNLGRGRPQYPAAYGFHCLLAVSTKVGSMRHHRANAGDVYLDRVKGEEGTSFSTARMAGVAVTYFQKHPEASCEQAAAHLVEVFGLPNYR
jgi:subtilisin family serine protease